MKTYFLIPIAAATLLFTSCKNEVKETKIVEQKVKQSLDAKKAKYTVVPVNEEKLITFKLEPKSDSKATGTVVFSQKGEMVTFKASLEGLTPGMHAIHIHEKADCSSVDGKSSGGHWNPTFKEHGQWEKSKEYHKGDIGNFMVNKDGTGDIKLRTDQWCIGCDDKAKNIVGKAIIVHQGTDDFTSQPSGAAGARVSCGGIIQ